MATVPNGMEKFQPPD